MATPILKILDKASGTFVTIAAWRGADGKSAYQAAQDAGYTGTETEFNTYLAELADGTALTTLETSLKTYIDDQNNSFLDQMLGIET